MAEFTALWDVLKNSANTLLESALEAATEAFQKTGRIRGQLDDLISAYESESLVLVLGAGVSMSYGLPDWNTLLQSLLLSATVDSEEPRLASLFTKIFQPSPLVAARFVRNHYKNKVAGKSFEEITREIIYKELSSDFHSPLMREICALVLAPARAPMLDCIITYNFDDILEREIRRLGEELGIDIPIRTIAGPESRPMFPELAIYHVHGYLPSNPDEPISHSVTLGEADYHLQYAQVYRWENTVQINKFADARCLFIGTSFSDPNLRRLLDIARAQHGDTEIRHYVVMLLPSLEIVEEKLEAILTTGANQLETPDALPKQQINELAKTLIALHMRFEQDDATSFGVDIAWISAYEDIPNLLKAIRTKDSSTFEYASTPAMLQPVALTRKTSKHKRK